MRIKRLEISGFGRWSQQNFDLIDGMQVIAGQNESGKTTLRAFIVGVLFGFPTKKVASMFMIQKMVVNTVVV
ncbi:hypothetical protein GCM10025879_04310 [Leuconostoc litchii]|uniref:ATP-binding protein n=1 Tax=Leuconostoc litchii TaxID=1981069 RepID=UPI0023E978CD|nr:AAA family ATPase [Leuconostoc litchii]GMA69185.1 hypothetical protein GCM10025879_04310 [Leuconostoc litchii]